MLFNIISHIQNTNMDIINIISGNIYDIDNIIKLL